MSAIVTGRIGGGANSRFGLSNQSAVRPTNASPATPTQSQLRPRTAMQIVTELLYDSAMPPCRQALMQAKLSAAKWRTRTDLTTHMESARAFIEVTPLNQITLDSLSAHTGISKYHLIRIFKETYSTTPLRFATEAKLTAAAAILPTASVTSTAESLGFADTTTFGRAFKRKYGKTPTEFRNLSRATYPQDEID